MANILDDHGVTAPAVLVRTSHRQLLGACPCWGREEFVPHKNRGAGLMPAIRLRSGEGLSNLTLGSEHGPRAVLRSCDLRTRVFSSAWGERTKSQG